MKKILENNIMKLSEKSSINKKLIFIHIPKTAGATFRSILNKNFPQELSFFIHDLYPEISLDYLYKIPDAKFNRYRLIAGHGAQYVLTKAKDFRSILFLRDPVNQIISSYYHIKKSPHNSLYNDLKKIDSISEYFRYLEDNNGFNHQTIYLSRNEDDFRQKKRFIEINENSYQNAVRLLEKIDYVFLTEYFNESLLILKKEFSINSLHYLFHNRTKKRLSEESNPELIQKIKHAQIWDYKIYEYAKQRYLDLRNKFSGEIDQEVAQFTLKNKIYNKTIGKYINIKSYIFNSISSSAKKEKSWEIKPVYGSN